MTIKEFSVGQEVYILVDDPLVGNVRRPIKTEVLKVGRKYVTVTGYINTHRFKDTTPNKDYLEEYCPGFKPTNTFLFATQEAATRYLEQQGWQPRKDTFGVYFVEKNYQQRTI